MVGDVVSEVMTLKPTIFRCWKCAVKGNCSNVDALAFMEDHVTENLIVAIVAKFMDGLAGGCVLFVVSSASEAKNLINIL